MKFTKKNGRSSFKSNRRPNFVKLNNSYSSNKPRFRGNIPQMYDKYIDLAKEASSSGDRIQSEYYYQFADHYSRLIMENNIKPAKQEPDSKKDLQVNSDVEVKENDQVEKNDYVKNDTKGAKNIDSKTENNTSEDSISSVPFIAQSLRDSDKSKK